MKMYLGIPVFLRDPATLADAHQDRLEVMVCDVAQMDVFDAGNLIYILGGKLTNSHGSLMYKLASKKNSLSRKLPTAEVKQRPNKPTNIVASVTKGGKFERSKRRIGMTRGRRREWKRFVDSGPIYC